MIARGLRTSQHGIFLVEAMIAVFVFAVGVLSMISMQAVAIAAQNTTQFRAEAEHLIDQLIGQIRMSVSHDTATGNIVGSSFTAFAHQATTAANCSFSGAAATNTIVTDWVNTVRGLDGAGVAITGKGLPGVTDARVQVQAVSGNGLNQLRVTLCWQGANDKTPHSHSVVSYID